MHNKSVFNYIFLKYLWNFLQIQPLITILNLTRKVDYILYDLF